jgi:hypothetical protein
MKSKQKGDPVKVRREIAELFCREQLAIMDGSLEAGMKRIGTERFEEMVRDVIRALPSLETK